MTTAMLEIRFRRCTRDHLERYERRRTDSGSMVALPAWRRALNLYGAKLMIESDRMPDEEKSLLIRDLASRITGDHELAGHLAAAVLERLDDRRQAQRLQEQSDFPAGSVLAETGEAEGVCPSCGGNGTRDLESRFASVCHDCNGRGVVPCRECQA